MINYIRPASVAGGSSPPHQVRLFSFIKPLIILVIAKLQFLVNFFMFVKKLYNRKQLIAINIKILDKKLENKMDIEKIALLTHRGPLHIGAGPGLLYNSLP